MFRRTEFSQIQYWKLTNNDFNIIFIQELLWLTIYAILSLFSEEGNRVVDAPNHLNWISRTSSDKNDYLRVILYINIHLFNLYFSL